MLPQVLESSYGVYKMDTAVLFDWISKSAEKCRGYVKPKRKGKAGSVRIPDALSQLELIVGSNEPVIQVPGYVIHAAKRAVSLRKSFCQWFQVYRSDAAVDVLGNESHWAFIKILEEIIQKLSNHSLSQVPAQSQSSEEPISDPRSLAQGASSTLDRPSGLNNLFSLLKVEELTQSFELESEREAAGIVPTVSAKAKQTPTAHLAASLGTDVPESPSIIALCFYSDLNKLQAVIKEQWTEYVSGRVDLFSVSVATNAALVLARRWEDEMITAVHPAIEAVEVLKSLHMNLEEDDSDMYSPIVRETLYLGAYKHLSSVSTLLPPTSKTEHLTVPPLEEFRYDPVMDRAKMSAEEISQEDNFILSYLFSDVQHLKSSEFPAYATDEITRGLQAFSQTNSISVWLTFATQILLDIVHITRPNMVKALDDIQRASTNIRETLEDHLNSLPDGLSANEQHKAERMSCLVDHIRAWVLTEQRAVAKTSKGKSKSSSFSQNPQFLYRHHPLFCGILATYFILEFHVLSIAEARDWGLPYVIHVYNAVRYHEDYSVQAWLDIDLAVSVHTQEHLFFGEAPRGSMIECGKKYTLLRGLPLQSYASDARVKSLRSVTGRRTLREDSDLVKTLYSAHGDGSSIQTAIGKIEHLLMTKIMAKEQPQPQLQSRPQHQSQPHWKRKGNKGKGKAKALKPTMSTMPAAEPDSDLPSFSPEIFLKALRTAFETELPALLIDYITLCNHAKDFVQALQGSLKDEIAYEPKVSGSGNVDMKTCPDLKLVCGFLMKSIINLEVETRKRGVTRFEKKETLEYFADPLSVAASTMVADIGDCEVMRLREFLGETGARQVLEGLIAQVDVRNESKTPLN